jgi:FemAB-related protein (PEP-CTERM system-associated)
VVFARARPRGFDVTAAMRCSAEPSSPLRVSADVSARAWDDYVSRRPEASVYHLAAWAGLVERVFGHRTRYLSALQGEAIVGVLPIVFFHTPLFGRFATSMPFLNYGGLVADTGEAAELLLTVAIGEAEAARSSYLELRHTTKMFERLATQTHKVAMVLPLQSTIDEQWRVLDRKLRNQVRKAEKSGLRVVVGGVELLDGFYDVMAINMRDLGSPVHAKRFFRDVLETFPDQTRLLSVIHNERPVAASLVIWHGDRLEVPWASSIRAYNPLCANVLLYWEMLKFAIERRFARFDFGRSTPHEGTYQFKSQWGAEPHQLYWEYWLGHGTTLPDRSPKNPKFSAAISVWRRLPVAVTRIVGPRIVGNIP